MSILAKIVIGIPIIILGTVTLLAIAIGAGAGLAEASFQEIKESLKKR